MPIYPMPPQTYPMPGAAPSPLRSAFAAAPEPPKTLTAPAIPQKKPTDWLDSVGKIARHVAMTSTGELAKQNGYTARDRAVGNDKLPGLQMEARLDRTMKTAGIGQAPTREQAMEHFSRAIRPAVAKPIETLKAAGVEVSDYDKMQEENPELPDKISDDDKAMLMLEMGLRIMSADPEGGLVGALGQAGLGTMGSWREIKAQREAKETRASERAEDRAFDREKLDRSEALDREELGLKREQMAMEPAATRTVVRGGLEVTEEYDAKNRTWREIGSGARWKPGDGIDGSDATAFMKDAQYLASVAPEKFKNEGEAALFLKVSAADRANPEATRQALFEASLKMAADPLAREEGETAVQAAARITEESVAYLQGGAAAIAAPEAPKPSKGVMAAIKSLVGMGDEAAGPEGDPAIAAPAQPAQPTQPAAPAQAPSKPIEGMSLEELQGLDTSGMSDEDLARAAERWEALNGG